MSNFKTLAPEAFITTRKNRLKIYDQFKIYLDNGETFEIELFNPLNVRVLAKIWINDAPISPAGIVIGANSRAYLERYIDSPQKFKFSTFEVDNVQATKAARERNGLIRVQFYSEKTSVIDHYKDYVFPFNGGSTSSGKLGEYNRTDGWYSTTNSNSNNIVTMNFSSDMSQIETGRVREGGKSDQVLGTTTGDFNSYTTSVSEYQILPKSLKQTINVNEIRTYCTECGTRIKKSNWKYCPNCGKNL